MIRLRHSPAHNDSFTRKLKTELSLESKGRLISSVLVLGNLQGHSSPYYQLDLFIGPG